MAKERLMTMVLAFSSGFSGDFSAIEDILADDTEQIEDSGGSLKDFGVKRK